MKALTVLSALGIVLRIFSFTLLIPTLGSLLWDEGVENVSVAGIAMKTTTALFGLMFLFVFLLGSLLRVYGVRSFDTLREREGYVIVGSAWMVLALLGAIPFLLLRTMSNPIDAVFEAMSGLTTTGATVLSFPLEQYPESVHLWRATMQWLGGIGIVVLSVAILGRLTQGGRQLVSMEAPGGGMAALKPKIAETARTLSLLYVSFSGILFVLYLIAMRFGPLPLGWNQASYSAALHTMTTISTGGFSDRTNSLADFGSPLILWIATLFMIVGGGSFTLYWYALHGNPRRLWASEEFRFYLGIIGAASLLVFLVLLFQGFHFGNALTHAVFQVAAFITTTGYTSADHNIFPDSARLVLFLMIFTGGMAGSTAGGIKVFRIQVLMKLTWREIQRLLHPRALPNVKSEGHLLSDEFIRRVIVFFFSYITLFIVGAFVFMYLGLDLVSGFSASATLIGNVGPGFGSVAYSFGGVHDLGKAMGILLMWIGRLEIFTVLLLFVPATYRD